MASRKLLVGLGAVLALLLGWFVWREVVVAPLAAAPVASNAADAARMTGAVALAGDTAPTATDVGRTALDTAAQVRTGVRGRVVDGRTAQPLPGVEVLAMRRPPNLERLWTRVRSLLRDGLWSQANEPIEILGRTTTGGDGAFELLGLPPGRVFLDGRSDEVYVRTPRAVRLARGEIADGIELIGAPGGGLRGVVLGPDGAPRAGAAVTLRPGLNALPEQLSQRRYRWYETQTDADGRFVLRGVSPGQGYVLSATHPEFALAEVFGVAVVPGQVGDVTVRAQKGAVLAGSVIGVDGAPLAGARLALAYLDVSRALFSADGRSEPWTTDARGAFELAHVAPGRVALVADAPDAAPSAIEVLTVVDGGRYDGLRLELSEGESLSGLVVDQDGAPVSGAHVEVRAFEPPDDPDAFKAALLVRKVEADSDGEGRFTARGVTARRVMVQASKKGYVGDVRMRVPSDADALKLELERGATVHGRVVLADGTPVRRFRVEARARTPRGDSRAADGDELGPRPPWQRGGDNRRLRLAEGSSPFDRGLEGEITDFETEDGRFSVDGVPPGEVRVRVRGDEFAPPDDQDVRVASGQTSDELTFVVEPGAVVRGTVVDESTGAPVADAQVTAHRARDEAGNRGLFSFNLELEDFDFLALSTNTSRRSALSDSHGRFELTGIGGGRYRVVARHPDLAKSSAVEVELQPGATSADVVLKLSAGGAVEGSVTGAAGQPVVDAMVVALSLSAGAMKSASTDRAGAYHIEGLTPGQYVVFKSRLDERASNLGYDLLGNLRLSAVTVRAGKTAHLDIHDAEAGTVTVWGVVREDGQPLSRVMVSALSSDRDGVLGVGLRAQPSDERGNYRLVGMKPGSYFFQVTRFTGRPQQASLAVEVPAGVEDVHVDLDLPSSAIAGRVVSSDGAPVAGVEVLAGVSGGAGERAPGLLGLIVENGVARARTDAEGRFELRGMAPATYHVTASGRRAHSDAGALGDARVDDLLVDGRNRVDGVVLTLPRAGRIAGTVRDASGAPVAGAEVHALREDPAGAEDPRRGLADLFGVQERPERSGADGRFELARITPGVYSVRADVEGLAPGLVEGIAIGEGGSAEVALQVVRGAVLRVRVTDLDGRNLPPASVSLLDGNGKPLLRKVSVVGVFKSLMQGRQNGDDTGWLELGSVPPDTYTVVVSEQGKPEERYTRTVRDGERVEWEIDMRAELERRRGGR